MKYKKLVLILSLFIIISIYLIEPYMANRSVYSFKDSIIRFHVKANSDSAEDQRLKNKVRDRILEEISDEFKYSKSIDETRNIIVNNITKIENLVKEVLQDEGKDYGVNISLGNNNFPTRKYGEMVLPAGEYESLIVTIGEGKGQNWWCVMFPPLCFVDINHSHTISAEKDLKQVLTEEEIELLLSNKGPNIVFKSKIAEVFEKTKGYFAQILNIGLK